MLKTIACILIASVLGPVSLILAQDDACKRASDLEDAVMRAQAGAAGMTVPQEQENAALEELNRAGPLFLQIEEIGQAATTAEEFNAMAQLLRRAITHFEEALMLSPCSSVISEYLIEQGYVPLRSLAYDAGNLELEGFAISRLLLFEPDNTGLLTDFAFVKHDDGKYQEAAGIFRRAEQLMIEQKYPDSVLVDIQIGMADAWLAGGSADSVLAVTERARLRAQTEEQVHLLNRYGEFASWDSGDLDNRREYERSLSLRSAGDLNGAAEVLQDLVDRVGNPAARRDVRRELGYTLWDQGKLEDALPLLQEVYRYAADSTAVADYAGLLLQLGSNALTQDQDRLRAHMYILQITRLPANRHSTWAHVQLAGLLRNHADSAVVYGEMALNSTSDSTLVQQLAELLSDVKRRTGDFESAAFYQTLANRHERP